MDVEYEGADLDSAFGYNKNRVQPNVVPAYLDHDETQEIHTTYDPQIYTEYIKKRKKSNETARDKKKQIKPDVNLKVTGDNENPNDTKNDNNVAVTVTKINSKNLEQRIEQLEKEVKFLQKILIGSMLAGLLLYAISTILKNILFNNNIINRNHEKSNTVYYPILREQLSNDQKHPPFKFML